MMDKDEIVTEDTLRKVYEALLENDIYGQKALDVVNSILNKSLLFRERRPGVR